MTEHLIKVDNRLISADFLDDLIDSIAPSLEDPWGQLQGAGYNVVELMRRAVYLNDPVEFGREVCDKIIADYHREILELQRDNPQTLIIGPAGHGKTTIGTVVFDLWTLARNPNQRILIGSKKAGNSENMLGEMKDIAISEKFVRYFGLWNDRKLPYTKWSKNSITIPRQLVSKEPTVTAVGVESSVPSLHAEVLQFDDLCDTENSSTEHQRKKLSQWFWGEYYSRRQPGSKLHGAGTRYHAKDLYSEIIEKAKEESWEFKVFQAWKDKDSRVPLWPEMYKPEELEKMEKDMGTVLFDMFYMGIAHLGAGGKIIKPEHIHRVEGFGNELFRLISVDPAVGKDDLNLHKPGADPDYFALGVWSVDEHMNATLIDLYRDRVSSTKQIQTISEFMKQYRPMYTAVESVVFSHWLPAHMQSSQYYPVLPYEPKGDKVFRLVKVQPHFENGRVRVLNSIPNLEAYEIEMTEFPGATHDDMVDMTSMALDLIYNTIAPMLKASNSARAG